MKMELSNHAQLSKINQLIIQKYIPVSCLAGGPDVAVALARIIKEKVALTVGIICGC
jgi:hypothetical protein